MTRKGSSATRLSSTSCMTRSTIPGEMVVERVVVNIRFSRDRRKRDLVVRDLLKKLPERVLYALSRRREHHLRISWPSHLSRTFN